MWWVGGLMCCPWAKKSRANPILTVSVSKTELRVCFIGTCCGRETWFNAKMMGLCVFKYLHLQSGRIFQQKMASHGTSNQPPGHVSFQRTRWLITWELVWVLPWWQLPASLPRDHQNQLAPLEGLGLGFGSLIFFVWRSSQMVWSMESAKCVFFWQ